MKSLFFLFIIIMISKITNARRRMFRKRDAFNCADSVSRIASDIAAKAALEAKNIHCTRYGCSNDKICSVKQKLADKATEAARIAQDNLASKIALVNELSDQKETVETILHELICSKKQLEEAINREIEALATSTTLKDVLARALQLASEIAVNADMVSNGLLNHIKSIDKILYIHGEQCHILSHEELSAKMDLEATRLAEKQAIQAAMNAKNNVFETEGQRGNVYS